MNFIKFKLKIILPGLLMGVLLIHHSFGFSELGDILGPVKSSDSPKTETTAPPVNSSSPLKSDSSKTMKLYTNTKCHYQIKYPANWIFEGSRDMTTPVSIENFTGFTSPPENPRDAFQENFIVGVTNVNNTDKTLEEAFEPMFKGYQSASDGPLTILKKTRITVSNHPALRVTMLEKDERPGKSTTKNEIVLIAMPGITYILTFITESSKESIYTPIFEDMLSSFVIN